VDGGAEGLEGEKEKMNDRRHNPSSPRSLSSLYLEPNQPLYVDVVDISDRPHAGMQFILTPPTPG